MTDNQLALPKLRPVILECHGVPVGQGAHRVSRQGYIYETSKGHGTWRQELVSRCIEAISLDHLEMITGPVEVIATFTFPRLKGHFKTGKSAHILKDGAPLLHTKAPDLDHLQRTLGDALKIGGIIKDDSLICRWHTEKIYGDHPGAKVLVCELVP